MIVTLKKVNHPATHSVDEDFKIKATRSPHHNRYIIAKGQMLLAGIDFNYMHDQDTYHVAKSVVQEH